MTSSSVTVCVGSVERVTVYVSEPPSMREMMARDRTAPGTSSSYSSTGTADRGRKTAPL